MAKLAEYAGAVKAAKVALDRATRKRDEWVTRCVDAGVSPAEVARVAGVSRGRVSQIAPVAKGAQPRTQAQKNDAPVSCVSDPGTVPVLPDTSVPVMSGSASTRKRTPYGRATVFKSAAPVAELLGQIPEGLGSCRVFLIGARPFNVEAGATLAEGVRAWALAEPGEGWATDSHYLADPDLPVLRFKHADGRRATIMRAAAWWGETDADATTCAAAWEGLGAALDAVPAFAGAGLADTPATAGRALWLRTIPEGKAYPVLSDEYRELIAGTAGQGRIELRPFPTGPGGRGPIEDFTQLDGRFMYAGLTWGMPVGEPTRWTGDQVEAWTAREYTEKLRGRGRWRISCTVPAGWAHVGMFMAPADGAGRGGWCYPCEPGQTFTTWADGSEIWAAMEQGWEPVIHEGLTWAEGKPLDAWRDALVSVWERANQANTPASRLAAKAVRSMLLYALGAFATRAHSITKSAPLDSTPDVPAGTEVRRVGDALVWQEAGTLSAWSMQTAHPEWSATVWARARTRLLTGRGVDQERVGALHLPVDRIVAFSTDALYLAGGSPEWADDGKPGRFRTKGTRPGAFIWPDNVADLYRLRDEAEAHR